MRYKGSKRSVGKAPGHVVFTGKQRRNSVSFKLVTYGVKGVTTELFDSYDALPIFKKDLKVRWLTITGLHDEKVIKQIGKRFNIHPLIQEDIANVNQRAKLETYEELLFAVMKMLKYNLKKKSLIFDQVSFILERNVLVVFQEEDLEIFDPILARLDRDVGKIRTLGADYLLYILIDAIVDHYYVVLESIGDELEDLDEALIENPTPQTMQSIRKLKREIVFLRKAVWPLREVTGILQHQDGKHISKNTRVFTHDLYDHVVQVIDLVETFKDLASGMLETYNSVIANRMNEVMKLLTVISTIFIPLTFITGLYGMNFLNMPELYWKAGYFLILGVMLGIAFFMIRYFKKKSWL